MLNNYETVFIMNPVLSDEQVKETASKFTEFLKENGSKIVFENNWGMRKLAYPIQKKGNGFYYLVEYQAPAELIAKLEVEFTRDERIMRFLTVSLEKDAIAYNERKRKRASEAKTAPAAETSSN
jgi:small subunit ribosomal protein S6